MPSKPKSLIDQYDEHTKRPGKACGVAALLEQLDAAVVDVVNGQVVHVVTTHGEVIGHGSGWAADGFNSPKEAEQVLNDARADRSPHQVMHGRPWW